MIIVNADSLLLFIVYNTEGLQKKRFFSTFYLKLDCNKSHTKLNNLKSTILSEKYELIVVFNISLLSIKFLGVSLIFQHEDATRVLKKERTPEKMFCLRCLI